MLEAKFVAIDAAHLDGKYKGMIMCATTQDVNGEIFILAHALVPKEDQDNWEYLLNQFKKSFVGKLYFFISDRDKGLNNAQKKNFSEIPHSKCLRHLSENFKKKYGQEKTYILKHMASSCAVEDMEMYKNLLRNGDIGGEIIQRHLPALDLRLYIEAYILNK